MGIAGEVEPGHIDPRLVHPLGVQGIALRHAGHADDGLMGLQGGHFVKLQRKLPGRNHNLLPKGIFQVQITAGIGIFCGQSDAGTHDKTSFFFSVSRLKKIPWAGPREFFYIFSGAVTPMSPRQLAITARTVSASFRRAESTWASSPLIRQAL